MHRRAYPVLALCGFVFYADAARSQASSVDSTHPLQFPAPEHHRFSGNADYVYDSISNTTFARFEVSPRSYNILRDFFSSDSTDIQTLTVNYSFSGRRLTAPPDSVLVGFSRTETRPVSVVENYPAGANGSARAEITLNDTDRATYRVRTWKKTQQERDYIGTGERGVVRAGGDPIITEGHTGYQSKRTLDYLLTERSAEMWMPIHDFLSLVSSRKIEGKINNLDLRLKDRAFQGLREFASHMNPLTPP
jgi:hypothetical protein